MQEYSVRRVKKITESTDCKLYYAYIILSICEDISDLLYG